MRGPATASANRHHGVAAATMLAVLTLSCGRESATPVAPSRVTQGPAGRLIRVVLRAPTTLAPGGTFQLGLHAVYSDGTARDVTPSALFHGDPPDVVSVSPTGLVTALNAGDARLSGHFERSPATVPVIVVPDGTFRVVGRVVEDGAPEVPVGGARVEAEGGLSQSTGFDGGYRLFGVRPQSVLRVSKPGYAAREIPLVISTHETLNVELVPDSARADFAGRYTLTIDAGSDCSGHLPEELRRRRYPAAVTQVGVDVRIVLAGAQFYEWYGDAANVLHGRADPSGAGLSLEFPGPTHCDGSFTSIVEVVDAKYLGIEGYAQLSRNGRSLAGTLSGAFQLYDYPLCRAAGSVVAGCQSRSHRITLTR